MAIICSLILGEKLTDINAQPFFFHKKEFLKWIKPFYDLSLDMYAYYKLKRKKNEEFRIEVQQKSRLHGQSSWNKNLFSSVGLSLRFIISAIKLRICQNI